MVVTKTNDVRDNFINYCDEASRGEIIVINRPQNKNVVLLSEREYNRMIKAKQNAEYLMMLDESRKQLEEGKVITKTIDELEAMENE